MENTQFKGRLSLFITIGILFLDQLIKIVVKTNMYYGEEIQITNWFYIKFIENNGMALGLQIFPKALQTIFRIIAAIIIMRYIFIIVRANLKKGYIVCISLILAGALGNIFDSIFYGAIFSASTYSSISTFVEIGEGYSDWLYGKVVDMFYFPLIEANWPDWIPFIGGSHFIFFSPIFNLADVSISCGIVILFLFYTKQGGRTLSLIKNDIKGIKISLSRLCKKY